MNNIHIIKTDEQYDLIMDRIIELASTDLQENTPESEEFEILTLLIQDFDNKHYPTPPSDPIEAIKFRMDQEELRPTDMIKYFGTTGRFYQIINKRRPLSLNMIKKLHEGLGISYDCLIA